jgi:hypothetical protein
MIISKPEVKYVGDIGEQKQNLSNYKLKINIITLYFSNINILS